MTTSQLIIGQDEKRIILQDQPGSRTIVLEPRAHLQYILSFADTTNANATITAAATTNNATTAKPRSILRFELRGDESHVEIVGLFAGKNHDQFAFETHTIHIGNNTFGHAEIKTLLADEATSDYFGLIRIEKNTHGNDGHLSHATMLLSEKAKSKSIPSLEIEASDVKAGHSASVGQVDEEALFYLMSRGLALDEAKRLMLDGFFEPLLEKIEDIKIAENLRKQLQYSIQ